MHEYVIRFFRQNFQRIENTETLENILKDDLVVEFWVIFISSFVFTFNKNSSINFMCTVLKLNLKVLEIPKKIKILISYSWLTETQTFQHKACWFQGLPKFFKLFFAFLKTLVIWCCHSFSPVHFEPWSSYLDEA